MTKQWFVLHTLTGQEQKAKRFIESQARLQELDAYIGDVVIPTEKVSETKHNKKTTVVRKFFPGYVLINIALYDDEKKLIPASWRFIRDTPGVIGFLGGEKPVPLTQSEMDDIFDQVEAKRQGPPEGLLRAWRAGHDSGGPSRVQGGMKSILTAA